MARLPRLSLPGLPHLVLQRGHNRQEVFVDDEDRRAYLSALREAAAATGVAVQGYALLDEAIWLLCTPRQEGGLSSLMQSVGRRYVAGHNRRHGRSGTLWDGRFRAALVDPALVLPRVLPFVEEAPVRAGRVVSAGDWRWSSAGHHLGRVRDPLVTSPTAYWSLGNTPFEREQRWARRLEEGLPASQVEEIAQAASRGWVLGGGAFLAQVAGSSDRPLGPRPRGRPRRDGAVPPKPPGAPAR